MRSLNQKKQYTEAITVRSDLAKFYQATPPIIESETGYSYARLGRHREALQKIAQLGAIARQAYADPFLTSVVYLGLGDKDQTFQWLDQALAVKSALMTTLINDPKWDALRSEPRFKELLGHLNPNR